MTIDATAIYMWDDGRVPLYGHWKIRGLFDICADNGFVITRRLRDYEYIYTEGAWTCQY